MRIDRARFLALTAVLSTTGGACASSPREPAIARIDAPPEPDAGPPHAEPQHGLPPLLPPDKPKEEPPASPVACAEDESGSMAACDAWKIDPTCESTSTHDCSSLGDPIEGFKPKIGERIAACAVKRPVTRGTGCKAPDWHRCIRDAVDTACIEPAMTAECERIVAGCKKRGAQTTFSVEQCAKIASSMGPKLREWALQTMSGRTITGTPMAEGCTLQYITVYQPWPKNWWTGR